MTLRARDGVAELPLYSGGDACAVDLSDNTNLWGAPPGTSRAFAGAAARVARYPSAGAAELCAEVARYAGVTPPMVVAGCGSDDVIDSAFRAFGTPGSCVAYVEPTFSMVPVLARTNGLRPVAVAHDDDAERLLASLRASDPSIVYLCSPNNPTGSALPRAFVERVLESIDALVILDEAYGEFTTSFGFELVRTSDRLLVTRTFSKAFGLAGLRVGYGVGAASVAGTVARARGPYKVGGVAEQVALAAMRDDVSWMREHARLAIEEREWLAAQLVNRGFETMPSEANFVLLPLAGAPGVATALRSCGIGVRAFSALPGIGDALRITAGPRPMLEALLSAFDKVVRP
ncbi:MAG: hisD [Gemmatimonadetes bacterium]|nr:hisD [Gemmatimonadota bacterium]